MLGFLLTFAALLPGPPTAPPEDTLRIGTATEGRTYYQIGAFIQGVAAEADVPIDVVATDGSVDNAYRLAEGELDLAILQNDVAFAAERGLYEFNRRLPGLRGIMMLYPEPIYVLVRRPGPTRLRPPLDYRIAVGRRGSGIYANARTILTAAGLWYPEMLDYARPTDAVEKLKRGEVEAVFINTIKPDVQALIDAGEMAVLSLPSDLVEGLTTTYSYFDRYTSDVMPDSVRTVAVKSMLVARSGLGEDVIHRLTERLHGQLDGLRRQFPVGDYFFPEDDFVLKMPLKKWHGGAHRFYGEAGIGLTQSYGRGLWALLLLPFVLLVTFGLLNLFLLSFNRTALDLLTARSPFLRAVKAANALVGRYKYLVLLVLVVTLALTVATLVEQVEREWAIRNNLVSEFERRDSGGKLLWLFVYVASGHDDGLFPESPQGKLLFSFIPLLGIGGLGAFLALFTSDHIKNQIMAVRGTNTEALRDHILLCGWNKHVPFLIRSLLHKNIARPRDVIVLADVDEARLLREAKEVLELERVTFIRGDAARRADLDKANFKHASTAIVVGDEAVDREGRAVSDSDARNVLKVLTIEKYCKELEGREDGKARKNRENIYTIAQIKDASISDAARDAMVDEIISLGDIESKILVQSVLNRGVSSFINEILTYNEFNDIYSHEVAPGSALEGQIFDDLLVLLRRRHVLLLSISKRPPSRDGVNGESGKGSEKGADEQAEGAEALRDVLTNPLSKKENEYQTQAGDRLIVLAQCEQRLMEAVEAIEENPKRVQNAFKKRLKRVLKGSRAEGANGRR